MQKVNTLRVEVKYVVELSDFEIPQELFEEMEDLQGHTIYPSRAQIEYPEVLDWLSENIKEGDACDWEYEIDEIE